MLYRNGAYIAMRRVVVILKHYKIIEGEGITDTVTLTHSDVAERLIKTSKKVTSD